MIIVTVFVSKLRNAGGCSTYVPAAEEKGKTNRRRNKRFEHAILCNEMYYWILKVIFGQLLVI
jgi:hypothetical protein